MNKQKLTHELFVGMVVGILGLEKTLEILKEAKETIDKIDKPK